MKKIFDPTEPSYTTVTLVVIVVAIVVKLVLGRYVKHKGEQLSSDALIVSGSDALFDAVITLSTLVAAGIMLMWNVSVDSSLVAQISLVIVKAGFEMLASPVNELLGSRLSPELLKQIRQEVLDFEGVHGVFDIILHNYGSEVLIGSLHVNVYDTMTAHEIHGLTRRISEQMFERHGIIMTVGIYAIATGKNKRTELQNAVHWDDTRTSRRCTVSTISKRRTAFRSMWFPTSPFTTKLLSAVGLQRSWKRR